jgi:hypothetical protein
MIHLMIIIGYDESLGVTLTRVRSVSDFVSAVDPVRLLTDCTSFRFEADCSMFADHAATTDEIKTCLADLKVYDHLRTLL